MQLFENVAAELRNEGVPFAEKWGDELNDLQLGRLRLKLREADIPLDDISVDPGYKDKKREWWSTRSRRRRLAAAAQRHRTLITTSSKRSCHRQRRQR